MSTIHKSRLSFIDLMRGLAMLVMIEVHVVNSMMIPTVRHEIWFQVLNFVNGMVAPSFIFISGFAFMLASHSKLDEFRKFGYPFWKQLGRILLIWFVGYLLHVPYFSLRNTIHYTSHDMWMKFSGVDVLQCIAFGLLLLFALRIWIQSDRAYLATVTAIGIFAVAAAEPVYRIDFTAFMPMMIADYFNVMNYSYFPLFPWLGFMSAGALSAWLFVKYRERKEEGDLIRRLAVIGLACVIIGGAYMVLMTEVFHIIKDIRPHFSFFAARLGCVFLILAGCYRYCQRRGSISPVILYPSQESLVVYFLHLELLYRKVWWDRSLVDLAGNNLTFAQCIGVTLGIIAVMLPVAWIWNYLKRRNEYFGRYAVACMFIAGGFIFIIK